MFFALVCTHAHIHRAFVCGVCSAAPMHIEQFYENNKVYLYTKCNEQTKVTEKRTNEKQSMRRKMLGKLYPTFFLKWS